MVTCEQHHKYRQHTLEALQWIAYLATLPVFSMFGGLKILNDLGNNANAVSPPKGSSRSDSTSEITSTIADCGIDSRLFSMFGNREKGNALSTELATGADGCGHH